MHADLVSCTANVGTYRVEYQIGVNMYLNSNGRNIAL
jgi:hypothetical protein